MDTAGPWDSDELFELQKNLCDELGRANRELATLEQSVLRVRFETFRHLNDGSRNITTIRECVSDATSGLDIEAIGVKGDIAGIEAQLRWVEARIDYLTSVGYESGAGDD